MRPRRLIHGFLIVAIVLVHSVGNGADRHDRRTSEVDARVSLALRLPVTHLVPATRGKLGGTPTLAFGSSTQARWLRPPVTSVCDSAAPPGYRVIDTRRCLPLASRPPPLA